MSHALTECVLSSTAQRASPVSADLLAASLKGVGDLSSREALNNTEWGEIKGISPTSPPVTQQNREDTGITMPEPVPEGMQILVITA